MITARAADPAKFESYTLLRGGRGFTLKGSLFVYKIDRRGGFYDEDGNYYNSYADPSADPTDGEPSDNESSIYIDSETEGNEYDEYAPDSELVKENTLVNPDASPAHSSHGSGKDHELGSGDLIPPKSLEQAPPTKAPSLKTELQEPGKKQEVGKSKEQPIPKPSKKLEKVEENEREGTDFTTSEEEDNEGFQIQFSYKEKKKRAKIAANRNQLKGYPHDTVLRVDFQNLAFAAAPKHVFNVLSKIVPGLKNVHCQRNPDTNRKTGRGYFVLKNRKCAKKLIKQEGITITHRPIYMSVEPYQDLQEHPITESELIPEWEGRDQKPQQK